MALRAGDEQGLAGLSMRRIARELGVEAMSLYNHVPNKAAIISGILERAMAGIELPDRDRRGPSGCASWAAACTALSPPTPSSRR